MPRNPIVPSLNYFVLELPEKSPTTDSRPNRRGKQALLTKVRDNRLIDHFLGVSAYSLLNQLGVNVPEVGRIESDELYLAVTSFGRKFVVPVQVKRRSDPISKRQVKINLERCRSTYPLLTPRPVAVQFVRDESGETIVMFSLAEYEGDIQVLDEKHYRLVPANQISADDLEFARNAADTSADMTPPATSLR